MTAYAEYRALTISQPFASLIADGQKWVENRTWFASYTGPLMIHAGRGTQYLHKNELRNYPTGAIVAVCRMVCCVHVQTLRDRLAQGERLSHLTLPEMSRIADHAHTEGPWAWVLAEVTKLAKPVPCSGQQGIWEPPLEVVGQVQRVLWSPASC